VRYWAVWLASGLLFASGCGGADKMSSSETESSPATALRAYLDAAQAGDADRVDDLLSSRFKARSNLTPSRREDFMRSVRRDARRVGDTILLDEQLNAGLAVVAVSSMSRPGAFAAPLVLEERVWKVEPFGLDLVYGESATAETLPRAPDEIEFGVNVPSELKRRVTARLWVDGYSLDLERSEDRPVLTFVARPPTVERGRHTVVAFAQAGDRVAAIAWTFTVGR
jgi:hypothetical protein